MEDDANLVREAVEGSVPAFTAIWSRHEAEVHDFALSLLRDKAAASELVNETFIEASERLDDLQEPSRLRVWLLAITRFQGGLVADEASARDHQPVLPDSDAERAVLASLVWRGTADLPLRERALLDLNLRHGLDGADLADALGVSPGEEASLRAWMAELEKGLAGYLIMRRADKRCPDLALMLRGWDGHLTLMIAGRTAHHITGCRVCEKTVSAMPSPLSMYASAQPAPLPDQDAERSEDVEGASA
ncbi:MAG: sigma-70 family RNA polymerase sigma factor [Acidimicrobiales bacterium]